MERGGPVEEEIMQQCIRFTKVQAMLYGLAVILVTSYSFIYVVIKRLRSSDYEDWEFAYGPFTLVNVTYSPNFEIACLYQTFATVTSAIHFSTIDLLMASALCYVTYQLKILQSNTKILVEKAFDELVKEDKNFRCDKSFKDVQIPFKYLNNALKEVIKFHLEIIRIVGEMECTFNTLLLMTYIGTLLMLCFEVYVASTMELNDPVVIQNLLELLIIAAQVLMVCFWGDELMTESQKIGTAIYHSNFVGCDQRFLKSLVMVNVRSNRPLKITAGKFADIGITVFAWVMRTSYSSFMVLRKSNAKQ